MELVIFCPEVGLCQAAVLTVLIECRLAGGSWLDMDVLSLRSLGNLHDYSVEWSYIHVCTLLGSLHAVLTVNPQWLLLPMVQKHKALLEEAAKHYEEEVNVGR